MKVGADSNAENAIVLCFGSSVIIRVNVDRINRIGILITPRVESVKLIHDDELSHSFFPF